MDIRSYRPEDAPACRVLLDGNTPPFFMPSERDEYATFLAAPRGTYLVGSMDDALLAKLAGSAIACGGYWLPTQQRGTDET